MPCLSLVDNSLFFVDVELFLFVFIYCITWALRRRFLSFFLDRSLPQQAHNEHILQIKINQLHQIHTKNIKVEPTTKRATLC